MSYVAAESFSQQAEIDKTPSYGDRLTMFRQEMLEGQPTARLFFDGYTLVRDIGDALLEKNAPSPDVKRLIDDSYWEGHPVEFPVVDHGEDGKCGTHIEFGSLITLDEHNVIEGGYGEALFGHAKVKPRRQGDIRLLALLGTLAHEGGHALLGGISRLIDPDETRRDYILASQLYLDNHPEEGFTGNWATDRYIQEERFAEGYARLAVRRVLKDLGYSARDRRALMAASKTVISAEGTRGANQIDHLSKVTSTQAPYELVEADGSDVRAYAGYLGYEKPLSAKQLVGELQELSAINNSGGAFDPEVFSKEEWYQRVQSAKSPGLKLYLKGLEGRRWMALHPKTNIAARYASAVALGIGAGIGTAHAVNDGFFQPSPDQARPPHGVHNHSVGHVGLARHMRANEHGKKVIKIPASVLKRYESHENRVNERLK